jgi:hypothetical protein
MVGGPEARKGSASQHQVSSCAVRGSSVRIGENAFVALKNVSGWVWAENVDVAMRHIALTVAYGFDDSDEGAIEVGLADTDADQDRWFEYPIMGEPTLMIRLARHPDAVPVLVRVEGEMDEILAGRLDTILTVLADVRVQGP